MQLRPVGFFSDLPHGLPSESTVRSAVADKAHEHEGELLKYLASGMPFIASPGVVGDVLSEDDAIIGTCHILTDGVWAWPSDLVYYVERYHARLPEAFMEHARANDWRIPDEIDLASLELGP